MEETTLETVDKTSDASQEIAKKKPGRPRLHPTGFQSVRSTLQKTVRLDFDVFSLWNHLKTATSGEHIRSLLTIFKEHMNSIT